MPDRDDLADQLSEALRWIHSRLGRSFTVYRGYEAYEGVALRGREPAFRSEDNEGAYLLDVLAPVASFRIDANELEDVAVLDEGNVLRLTFRGGQRVDISDEG